jgi:hypothetical protein
MSFRRLKDYVLWQSTIRPRMVVPSEDPERRYGVKIQSRGTSPPHATAAPPLFALSSRGRVLAEGSALDSPHMVPRPGMASLHLCHPSRSEGSLRELAFQGASPAGKASTMNTYAIPKLNSFRIRTYAMRDFAKSFGMNTCAKWSGGRGHPVKSPAKSNPACPLSQTAPRLSASLCAPIRQMSLPRPPSDDAVYGDLRGRCTRFGLISSQTCDVTCLRKLFWCRSCLALP